MTTNHSEGYLLEGANLQHVLIAERAIGHKLPLGAEIHHANGDRSDNRNENLVVCPSRAYHMLLHMRMKARQATGDPSKRRCVYCKAWDDPEHMTIRKSKKHGNEYRHRRCHAIAEFKRKRRNYSTHEGRS